MKYVLIIYVIILIVGIIYTNYHRKAKDTPDEDINEIIFNTKNKQLLQDRFSDILLRYAYELDTTKDLNKTLEELSKNNVVKIGPYQYYIYVFEHVKGDNFVNRVHEKKEYEGLTWADIINSREIATFFERYKTDDDILLNMFNLSKQDKVDSIDYFWTSPNEHITTREKAYFSKWENGGKEGLIGISYTNEYLEDTNKISYSKYIDYKFLIGVSLVTLVIAIIIYRTTSKSNIGALKAIFFLLITNIYLIYYVNLKEVVSSGDKELIKNNEINSGILSISFLVAANIFILSQLYSSDNRNIYVQTGIMFGASLLFLLISALKNTNYQTVDGLFKARIIRQFAFNFAIILNIIIILNYIFYVFSEEKSF